MAPTPLDVMQAASLTAAFHMSPEELAEKARQQARDDEGQFVEEADVKAELPEGMEPVGTEPATEPPSTEATKEPTPPSPQPEQVLPADLRDGDVIEYRGRRLALTNPEQRGPYRMVFDVESADAPGTPSRLLLESDERVTRLGTADSFVGMSEEAKANRARVRAVTDESKTVVGEWAARHGFTVEDQSTATEIHMKGVDAQGRQAFTVKRRMSGPTTANNAYLAVGAAHQRKRIGSELDRELEQVYRRNGVTAIRLSANIDVGAFCLPMRAHILTRDGWKRSDEVRRGDETLGWDAATDTMQWTPVTEVVAFDAVPFVRIEHRDWALTATLDHRVIASELRTRNQRNEWGDYALTPLRDLLGSRVQKIKSSRRIKVSAPYAGEDRSGLSVEQAAVLAWLVTDGHVSCRVRKGRKSIEVYAGIGQTKPEGRKMLEALFDALGYPGLLKKHGLFVPAAILRDLYLTLGRGYGSSLKDGLSDVVLKMGPAQLESFCEAAYMAEGDMSGRMRFFQNPGPMMDAAQLAFFLRGNRVTVPRVPRSKSCASFAIGRGHVTLGKATLTDEGIAPAWCVMTGLGSWVTELDGHIMLTGNSWARAGYEYDPNDSEPLDIDQIEERADYIRGHMESLGLDPYGEIWEEWSIFWEDYQDRLEGPPGNWPSPLELAMFGSDAAYDGEFVDDDGAPSWFGKMLLTGNEAPSWSAVKHLEPEEATPPPPPEPDYGIAHRPPDKEDGATLDDLSEVMPDALAHPEWYTFDPESLAAARAAEGNPDAVVPVYRAAPAGATSINPGDWVTTSRAYAEEHQFREEGSQILAGRARAGDLTNDGNSGMEYGYMGDQPIGVQGEPSREVGGLRAGDLRRGDIIKHKGERRVVARVIEDGPNDVEIEWHPEGNDILIYGMGLPTDEPVERVGVNPSMLPEEGGLSPAGQEILYYATSKDAPEDVGDEWVAEELLDDYGEQTGASAPWLWTNTRTGEQFMVKDRGGQASGGSMDFGDQALEKEEAASKYLQGLGLTGTPTSRHNGSISVTEWAGKDDNLTSLQSFEDWLNETGDNLAGRIRDHEDVLRLVLADVTMGNADRHDRNLLVGKGPGGLRMYPIDHNYVEPFSASWDPAGEFLGGVMEDGLLANLREVLEMRGITDVEGYLTEAFGRLIAEAEGRLDADAGGSLGQMVSNLQRLDVTDIVDAVVYAMTHVDEEEDWDYEDEEATPPPPPTGAASQPGELSPAGQAILDGTTAKNTPEAVGPEWTAEAMTDERGEASGASAPYLWTNSETGEQFIVKDKGSGEGPVHFAGDALEKEEAAATFLHALGLEQTPTSKQNGSVSVTEFAGGDDGLTSLDPLDDWADGADNPGGLVASLSDPDDVLRMTLADIAMGNGDRHEKNVLVGEDADGNPVLYPIDHNVLSLAPAVFGGPSRFMYSGSGEFLLHHYIQMLREQGVEHLRPVLIEKVAALLDEAIAAKDPDATGVLATMFANLDTVSPEQVAEAIMQATGYYRRNWG